MGREREKVNIPAYMKQYYDSLGTRKKGKREDQLGERQRGVLSFEVEAGVEEKIHPR